MPTFYPETAREAADLLASSAGPVFIRGAGTRADWQPAPPPDGLTIETTRLSGPGDLRPENLSATFPAGLPLSAVQAQLRTAGLWFPVEHLNAPDATLGGCLAAGFDSPLRLGFGAARDWVLGLEVATPGGLLHPGGAIIKNVAGYDLVKLHLGAWGRFGLITRATLRLVPLPAGECAVTAAFDGPAAADAAVRRALASGARPVALELNGGPDGLRLTGRLTGEMDRLPARAAALAEALGPSATATAPAPTGHTSPAPGANSPDENSGSCRRRWRLKLSLPAPGVAAALGLLARALDGLDWAVAGHAGSGVFTVHWDDPAGPEPVLCRLRGRLGPGPGLAAVTPGFAVPEGEAARIMTGRPGWVSFPPRPPRSQDRLEVALRRALVPGPGINPHLPSPPEASL